MISETSPNPPTVTSENHPIPFKIKALVAAASVLIFLPVTGCEFFAVVPFTLTEFKTYLVGKEESFSYPLNQVLEATVYNLDRIGFDIQRVERFNQKGLIYAVWKGTTVNLHQPVAYPASSGATTVTGAIFSSSLFSCSAWPTTTITSASLSIVCSTKCVQSACSVLATFPSSLSR